MSLAKAKATFAARATSHAIEARVKKSGADRKLFPPDSCLIFISFTEILRVDKLTDYGQAGLRLAEVKRLAHKVAIQPALPASQSLIVFGDTASSGIRARAGLGGLE
jgi:hypothetical protein